MSHSQSFLRQSSRHSDRRSPAVRFPSLSSVLGIAISISIVYVLLFLTTGCRKLWISFSWLPLAITRSCWMWVQLVMALCLWRILLWLRWILLLLLQFRISPPCPCSAVFSSERVRFHARCCPERLLGSCPMFSLPLTWSILCLWEFLMFYSICFLERGVNVLLCVLLMLLWNCCRFVVTKVLNNKNSTS